MCCSRLRYRSSVVLIRQQPLRFRADLAFPFVDAAQGLNLDAGSQAGADDRAGKLAGLLIGGDSREHERVRVFHGYSVWHRGETGLSRIPSRELLTCLK